MKIVDVLGARVFKDGECIITQVQCWDILLLCVFSTGLVRLKRMFFCCFLYLQGEKADCFYIVESGEVKIMIKSKVSS